MRFIEYFFAENCFVIFVSLHALCESAQLSNNFQNQDPLPVWPSCHWVKNQERFHCSYMTWQKNSAWQVRFCRKLLTTTDKICLTSLTSFTWQATSDKLHMTGVTWQASHDNLHMTSFTWQASHDKFHMIGFKWQVSHDRFHMTGFTWHIEEQKIFIKIVFNQKHDNIYFSLFTLAPPKKGIKKFK